MFARQYPVKNGMSIVCRQDKRYATGIGPREGCAGPPQAGCVAQRSTGAKRTPEQPGPGRAFLYVCLAQRRLCLAVYVDYTWDCPCLGTRPQPIFYLKSPAPPCGLAFATTIVPTGRRSASYHRRTAGKKCRY